MLNAVDLDRYERDEAIRQSVRQELGIGDSEIVLGAVGRIEPQKRFDVLIETFAQLHEERPEIRLLIAGEGSQFHRSNNRSPSEDSSRSAGCWDIAPRSFGLITLSICSSNPPTTKGPPPLSSRRWHWVFPVVATEAGGTGQLLQDRVHGRLVPCRDTTALRQAITETLDHPAAAVHRRTAARLRVEKAFSFHHRTRRLERIYRQVVRFGCLSDRRLAEEEAHCEADPIAI